MKKTILIALLTLTFPILYGGAVVDSGEAVFEVENSEVYFDCFGEMIYTYMAVPYTYHYVETPSGKTVYSEMWNVKGIVGVIIGLESGRVWDRTDVVSPLISRSSGGDNWMYMYTFKSVFVEQETGARTIVHETYHISANANGELQVDKYSINCKALKN